MQSLHRSIAYLRTKESWEDLVPEAVAKSLMKEGILSPTKIQAKAITASLDPANRIAILQSQNGTGKTLAFLLLTALRIEKIGPMEYKQDTYLYPPQAIIVAHSLDAGRQVLESAKLLEDIFPKIKFGLLTTRDTKKTITKCQVLIGTPSTIDWGLHHEILYLNKLKVLVVDEAEYLLTNPPGSESLFKMAQTLVHPDQQLFFFAADFTKKSLEIIKSLNRADNKVYESLLPSILRMPPGISHYYMVSSGSDSIHEILKMYMADFWRQTLIFVNSRDSAKGLSGWLARKRHSVKFLVGEHEPTPSEVKMSPLERERVISAFKENEIRTLVTTDIAARGLDFRQVGLVINYHLPVTHEKANPTNLDVGMYLHRAGRTGRFGDSGIVLNVLTDPDEIENIKRIEDAYSIRMTELDSLEGLRLVLTNQIAYADFKMTTDESNPLELTTFSGIVAI